MIQVIKYKYYNIFVYLIFTNQNKTTLHNMSLTDNNNGRNKKHSIRDDAAHLRRQKRIVVWNKEVIKHGWEKYWSIGLAHKSYIRLC
jgi:hypothetical protein